MNFEYIINDLHCLRTGVATALSDPRTHVLLPLLVIIVGSCCCCRVDCFITAE